MNGEAEAAPGGDPLPDDGHAGLVAIAEVEVAMADGSRRVAMVRASGVSRWACELALLEAKIIADAGRIAFEDRMRPVAH